MRRLITLFTAVLAVAQAAAWAQVHLGSDVLAGNGFRELQGKRVGLITNPSGVNRRGESTVEILRRAPGVRLVALFGPEHGIYGNVKAGDLVVDGTDQRTGLPIRSLYGATRKPTPAMLKGLDALVYDLQDTGVRSYTFISTMGLAMEACAEAGIEFIVLDRPNPLGGLRVEGPLVDERFRSFVSQWFTPYVYGMTCGELARMINAEGWIRKPCHLTVVPMQGWRRSMVWRDTRLPWVPTSPNIPRHDSPLYYASTGLFGEVASGSGLSIGGVFKRPFECVTALWLDADRLSRQMNSYGLPGVTFPTFSVNHEGRPYRGVELRFTDPARAPLVAINLYLHDAVKRVTRRDLLAEAVKHGKDFQVFDRIVGTGATRAALLAGRSVSEIVRAWNLGEEAFRAKRQKYLLYPDAATQPTPLTATPLGTPSPRGVPPLTLSTPPVVNAPPAAGTNYVIITVSRGDTIDKIARDFGIRVSAIAEANPRTNVTRLKVGQKLKIPRR